MLGEEGRLTCEKRGEPGKYSKDVCSLLDGAMGTTLPRGSQQVHRTVYTPHLVRSQSWRDAETGIHLERPRQWVSDDNQRRWCYWSLSRGQESLSCLCPCLSMERGVAR